ncbi:methyltransferase domain-containing protein [Roseinatronobacter sp.]|uniref:methyltransferase domain-containing protein n=1 Tax=Roseinatronobacter sp. TaxID=1945755 RepID=UPI0025F0E785|nr:methyltransferase domain-containing protein [Roseibaca sp.]
MTTPRLTDRAALLRNRARAGGPMFLHDLAREELQDRLGMVNRTFTAPAIVSGFPTLWGDLLPGARVVPDTPVLDLAEGAHDLVIHAMALHWADDPIGQLVQARRALRPDGLFLGVLFGGQTLAELRAVLAQAESELRGGLSARILPMAEIRDLGAALQRAGFALPVADSLRQSVAYQELDTLFADLRAMGERNALAARPRSMTARALFSTARKLYAESFATRDGAYMAGFELIFLSGWAPSSNQPKPLRPGSAKARLADALGANEVPLPETVKMEPKD